MKIPGQDGELHRQIYGSRMQYPLAFKTLAIVAFNAGLVVGALTNILAHYLAGG